MKRNHDKEYEGSLLTKKILEEKQKRQELKDRLEKRYKEEVAKVFIIYILIGIVVIGLLFGLIALLLSHSEPLPF